MTTPREQAEYSALRATIRERGTMRVWVFVAGLVAWAALAIALSGLSAPPLSTLVPLLVLGGAFEGVFALHVGVERIGRYLQVFHGDRWEDAAAAFGRPKGAAAVDPLFSVVFGVAALLNSVPALIVQPTPQELIFIGGAHALFGVRIVFARIVAARQRAIDRARFEEMGPPKGGRYD